MNFGEAGMQQDTIDKDTPIPYYYQMRENLAARGHVREMGRQ